MTHEDELRELEERNFDGLVECIKILTETLDIHTEQIKNLQQRITKLEEKNDRPD